jgi:hypothetical protein
MLSIAAAHPENPHNYRECAPTGVGMAVRSAVSVGKLRMCGPVPPSII